MVERREACTAHEHHCVDIGLILGIQNKTSDCVGQTAKNCERSCGLCEYVEETPEIYIIPEEQGNKSVLLFFQVQNHILFF